MIDDDENIVNVVQDILTESGYAFDSAGNGSAGLQKAKSIIPNLIILDIQLPDMTGFDVCQAIRQDIRTKNIPILMLTGHFINSKDKVKGLDTGADDYIVKPFDNNLLLAKIEAICRRNTYFL